MKIRYIIYMLIILLSGCITPMQTQFIIQQPPDVIQKRVTEAYEENDPVFGLTLIEGAKQRYPEENWEPQRTEGISMIVDAYTKAIEDNDWQEVLKNYRSLKALGKSSEIEDTDEAGIKKNLILSYIRNDNPVLGLTVFSSQGKDLHFTNEEYKELLAAAEKEQHTTSLDLIKKAVDLPVTNQEMLTPEQTRKLLKGMGTIWVDRGIKVDQGVGLPDRVIGSGFFIDTRGYMLTNHHVISSEVDPEYEGYSRLFIRLPDSPKERIPAKVVGWDTLLDLALLKVEYTPEYIFSFTDKELGPGEHIYAIGSPGGLESTITAGIVSATDRRLLQIGDTTQIDVPINHGNSGGPLIDRYGNVVGVVFAGIESFEGINFAIPGKWINLVIDQLYTENEVLHPWLGAAVYEQPEGLEILYVFPDSPASISGIQVGDIITGINGFTGENIGEYQYSLMHHKSGELISVKLNRDGEEQFILSSLGVRPDSPFSEAKYKDAKEKFIFPLFGFTMEDAGSTLWEKRYRVSRILSGMPADETGLSVNDPFILQSIELFPKEGVALLKMTIKKRKAGFLESSIQLGAYIDGDYFL